MHPALDTMAELCGAIPWEGGVILGLFLSGLAGSPLHCGPMCGGFVLGQVADRMAAMPATRMCEWRRVEAGALLPYHAGRLTTYAALGAVAGMAGALLGRLPWLPTALLILAAGLFAAMAWRAWFPPAPAAWPGWRPWPRRTGPPRSWWRPHRHGRFATGPRGFALGLLLGFLPCGFLYAALAVSAATQDPLSGALGLAAFGAGTIPVLAAIGIAGHAAGRHFHATIAAIAPFILVANAAVLTMLAIRGLIA